MEALSLPVERELVLEGSSQFVNPFDPNEVHLDRDGLRSKAGDVVNQITNNNVILFHAYAVVSKLLSEEIGVPTRLHRRTPPPHISQ